ncbi:carbohydrate-binding protein [uncultured Aquimarina sp.]|uniref:carbohydrate-binding protein n=1 Tax=uncultured Aquimarina sp. TaxID=575652 RepID=UPI002626CF53|nr:carbohydrate-binding protein [uncultured Aquimarina sp.]
MKNDNQNLFALFKSKLTSKVKQCCLLFILFIFSNTIIAQQPETDWLAGSWGITYPVFGGSRLNKEISNGYDYHSGSQEIVDELPTVGHIITNLSYFANSHYFTLSANTNIDVANEIHPSIVPSAANDEIIFDVLQTFKNADKKIILYISCSFFDRASADVQAAWKAYYTSHYDGTEYTSYKYLIQGFIENVKDYADGYWLDTFGGMGTNGRDFVEMIKTTDPGSVCGVNASKKYYSLNGSTIKVDSDGINDDNDTNYKVVVHEPLTGTQDFTHGHVTPIAQKAPVNSWGYDEFTLTNMVDDPYATFNGESKLKHAWFPTRARWHLPQEDLVFETEQAYRFVRRLTDVGAAVTWATTTTPNGGGNEGHMMADEMAIMKEINNRLLSTPKPDYVPYTRPEGAFLVGEVAPNYHQFIDFPKIPNKQVNDPDFMPFAFASSGAPVTLTSSNTNVATIVNNKIRIKGAGTTNITASQNGNATFAAAATAVRQLTVTSGDSGNSNLALSGIATQSSNHPNGGGEAFLAIDKNTNGKWSGGSVTRTSPEIDPWWQVDLKSEYSISTINVFGRTDACCDTRLSNFDVIVIDANNNTTYSKTFTTAPSPSIAIDIGGVTGQIIKIQQHSNPTSIVLNLAEVEVYGSEKSVCTTIQAEDYDTMSGVVIESSSDTGGGQQVGYIQDGDWISFNNIDLTCATAIDARVSSQNSGGDIEVRLDGVSGTLVATIPVVSTGSWTNYETISKAISSVSGTHDVYFVFTGGSGYLLNLNWIEFNESTTITIPENQTIGPWNITELREVPDWRTTTVDAVDGMTGILYESIEYLGKKVEVFAYYSAPSGTPPAGGWPAAIFAHGGGGTAFPQAVKYWNDHGYAAISMDLEGQYPNNEKTPNPGPKRVGVWDDYKLPIKEQWYYHAVAQILKAHSLIASFPEVNANKIGVLGASWGGTLTSTVMGVDSRLAWAIPIYGAGFLSESDGHQGDALAAGAETEFVNTYYDGSVYFDNVTFPTLWLNGVNDYHFSLSCQQLSSQAVQGSTSLLYLTGFPHGHLTWRRRDEVYMFANSVVHGDVALPQLGKPYISSNIGSVIASSEAELSSAQLFYTNDDDTVDLNDKEWITTNASVSGNTISANIPANAEIIFFKITDSRGLAVTSEYLSTSETPPPSTGENIALNGVASQSTTSYNGYASLAIDGNTDGEYSKGSVTHTKSGQTGEWWQVKLNTTTNLGKIKIFNRTDNCCSNRLSNFTVKVGDGNGSWVFSKTYTTTPNPSITVDAGGVFGKTVRIITNTTEALSLAEVEVYEDIECAGFSTIQAQNYNSMSGIFTETTTDSSGNKHLGFINNGDWSKYDSVDFTCATSIEARVSSKTSGGNIEVRLGSISGQLIGTINVPSTKSWSSWTTVSTNIDAVNDSNDLYLVYKGGNGYLFNVNWIRFSNTQVRTAGVTTSDQNQLFIYPNPVTDQVNISLNTTETSRYTISDMNGKTILKGVINEGSASFDINGLAKGLYLLKISNRSKVLTGKIIKQ